MMMSMKVLNEYLSSLDSSLQVVVDDQLPVLETAKLLGFGSVETVVLVAFVALALIRRREVESEEEALKQVVYIDPDLAIEEFAPTFQVLSCLLVAHPGLTIPEELGFDRSQLWFGYTHATNNDLQLAAERVRVAINIAFPAAVSAAS
jgi:ethanolamine utilization microcompartment shell protein EutS